MRDEVLHEHIGDTSGTTVRLDHHSLVATICVDVAEACMMSEDLSKTKAQLKFLPVNNVRDCSVGAQAANGASSGLVAPN